MREGDAREGGPRRLIITADDLGLSAAWDQAIEAACDRGVVTSVSIMTTGPTFERARDFVISRGLDHGVHLDALRGEALSPRALGQLRPGDVARAWAGQLGRAFEAGLRPSHVNAHYHLHLWPSLFGVAVELARRFGVRWIRLPDEPPWHAAGRGRLSARLKTGALWLLSSAARAARTAGAAGVGLVSCRGIGASGELGAGAWEALLARLRPGVTEVMCHPGQGEEETSALLSAEVRARIDARAERISFREIEARR